ncbi:hypothetical protein IDSA_04130 [Pseudidiomarina salinarum]|uniref:Uncharacterized protein n=1 Tax=Pseudidiomarina salinarum TaxID=435908 RepID=A0A094J1H8_9GAMM|nr:hypothetical protein [Pseudidiomarina salinarum]KFZ31879.1 hypothetical protein IDSA_04130 [Pseudidiomarina salinarum]RUO70347.1 hypothetical protein CWI79_02455 [Pseudidiomarina salinarum]
MIIQPDVIGLILEQPATETTDATYINGWHINFPAEVPELATLSLTRTTSHRGYGDGGAVPVCYQFADQATWEAREATLWPEPAEV